MDIGDIISGLVLLSFVVGPIIEAMRKGGQKKPPNQTPPSTQPRSAQSRVPQKPSSAPLQPKPLQPQSSARTQTSASGTTTQPKQGGWQTSNTRSANDLQARLEEARRRVQEQQARDNRGSSSASSNAPSNQQSSSRRPPASAQPQRPLLKPRQQPSQQPQLQTPQPQPSFSLLGESETTAIPAVSLETSASITSVRRPPTQRKKRRRPVVQNSKYRPLLALDGNSIQRGIIWKQILDKPRYKQRLQERKAFPHR